MLTCYHLASIRAQQCLKRPESSLTLITVGDRSEILPNGFIRNATRGSFSCRVPRMLPACGILSLGSVHENAVLDSCIWLQGKFYTSDYRAFYDRSQGKRENK